MKKFFLLLIAVLFLLIGCEKGAGSVDNISISIYQFKDSNLSAYASVQLSDDRTRITGSSGDLDKSYIVSLKQGFFMNGTMGLRSGYLSLTIDEYMENLMNIGIDSLNKLVANRDPYKSYYNCEKGLSIFNTEDTASYSIDTAHINKLIEDGELGKYFDKLK